MPIGKLRKALAPTIARELREVEGKAWQDRRLIAEVVRRVGCALRKMQATRVVEGERTQAGQVWPVAQREL